MKKLQLTARCKIHPGKYDAFVAAAKACMASVRARDKGTQQYDWFVDAGKQEGVVRETYADSDALLAHVANLGEAMGALLGASDMSLEIYGSPSQAVLDAAAAFPTKVYAFLQGL